MNHRKEGKTFIDLLSFFEAVTFLLCVKIMFVSDVHLAFTPRVLHEKYTMLHRYLPRAQDLFHCPSSNWTLPTFRKFLGVLLVTMGISGKQNHPLSETNFMDWKILEDRTVSVKMGTRKGKRICGEIFCF